MDHSSTHDADVAAIASLLADDARCAMLFALSDGRSLAAGDLARVARVAPATASVHLAKLVQSRLVSVAPSGRHRLYRLRDPAIVGIMESLAGVAAGAGGGGARVAPSATCTGIRLARTCYDHLAGRVGVHLTEALIERRELAWGGESFDVTAAGARRFDALGIDVDGLRERSRRTRRHFARACLDWSERRHHLAGALGAALCDRLLALEWFERLPSTRALRVTGVGRRALRREFGVVAY